MTLDPSRLAAIQARADKATDGPWQHTTDQIGEDEPRELIGSGNGVVAEAFGGHVRVSELGRLPSLRRRNAEFIAHAREDIPYLLAELARLQAEHTELRKFHAKEVGDYVRKCNELEAARDEAQRELARLKGEALT